MTNLPLSGARLWDSLMEMARIGATPQGGCDRQALTPEDGEGRALLARWASDLNLTMTVDRVGNMAILRPGRDPARRPVAIGSHLDTQPTGGKFDGVLGVLAGLEIMRALHESGTETEAPILLINWTNEEGARFSPPMLGSGVAFGAFKEADVLDIRDPTGVAFGNALSAISWAGSADPTSLRALDSYFELHIEQGPVLEREGIDLGIVTQALGQRWLDVTVTGSESHAGGPMDGRRDALLVAAEIIRSVEPLVLSVMPNARGTVGRVGVSPGSRNVVPGKVTMSVDLRHGEEQVLDHLVGMLELNALAFAANRNLTAEVVTFWSCPITPFDETLAQTLRDAATARGLTWRDMPTGIGHDAVYAARHVPTVMLFTPCLGGISHHPDESITPAQAEGGLRVLADAVLATADRPTP